MEFGLIGEKLGHSFSKQIHERMGYSYELCELPAQEVRDFFKKGDFRGVNVTIPYKRTALECCDEVSEAAARIGCVNTVVRRGDGTLFGDNTDCGGFLYMARRAGAELSGKNVLILGSGGTSLTVGAAAAGSGAKSVSVASRTGNVNYQNVYDLAQTEVIINTTPVGMYPKNGAALVSPARFPRCCAVLDVVYNPLRTELIMSAEGLPRSGGLPMLVAQAVGASALFTGRRAPEGTTEEILSGLARECSNIVLIGMPGCGKSSVGALTAGMLGRPFADIDAEIEKEAGMSIPAIFEKFGETHFRDMETRLCARFGAEHGLVISTGGGAVLRGENVRALRQNGRIYRLFRDELATEGRPLSRDADAVRNMRKEREPHYLAASDAQINNDRAPADAAMEIIRDFENADILAQ